MAVPHAGVREEARPERRGGNEASARDEAQGGDAGMADGGADVPAAVTAADTDVGNLLAMLGAARAVPQEAGMPVSSARDGGRKAVRQDMQAAQQDMQSARQDMQAGAAGRGRDTAAKTESAGQAPAGDLPDTDMPASEADQIFRLVRSDGKGKDVDIRISGDGERTTLKDANPTGPRGETVTDQDLIEAIPHLRSGADSLERAGEQLRTRTLAQVQAPARARP